MGKLSNTHGIVIGIANKRSIAWAIARAADQEGARLLLTYQSERLEENVRALGATLSQPPVYAACDVADDSQIAIVAERAAQEFGGLDFLVHAVAFAPREALVAPFVETTRDAFRLAMDVSAYSLVAVTRAVRPLMQQRGGGSVLTLTYLGSERVFPNYNVMGVAKAALEACVRYLAGELGADNIRVNAISAGPVKTLAASGIAGFSDILHLYRERAPLRRNVEASEIAEAALFLLSPAGKAVTAEVMLVDAGYHAMGM